MTQPEKQPHPESLSDSSGKTQGRSTKKLESVDLFAGQQEIEILHSGETYRLRQTRNGKLILTK